MTDKQLKSGIKKNPHQTRRAVFDEYCNYVYAVIINMLKNIASREDIEECVSDTFADFFRNTDKLKNSSEDIKCYISTIARRRAVDTYRKLKNEKITVPLDDIETIEICSEMNVEKIAERSAMDALILEKVNQLGDPDSTIILQHYFFNRTFKEIGASISMNAAAVQKRSIRAREKLRILLTEAEIIA